MAARQELQWLLIDSFAPGVTRAGGGSAKTIANRYSEPGQPIACPARDAEGCAPTAFGTLGIGPGYSGDRVIQAPFDALAAGYPGGIASALIVAGGIASPVRPSLADADNPLQTHHDQLFLAYSWFHDAAGGTNYSQKVRARTYKLHVAGAPTYDLLTLSDADMWGAASAATFYTSPFYHGFYSFSETVQGTASSIGVMNFAFYPWRAGLTTSIGHRSYPDAATPSADSVATPAAGIPYQACSHQGRYIYAGHSSDTFGGAGGITNILFGGEDLLYYPVRDSQTGAVSAIFNFIEENQSGIRVMQSMNANELLIIKARGGGAIIRGSLDEPEIVRLPGIHSPGDIYCKPAITPLGVVYGGRDGIYVWNGGDISESISRQLDSRSFWYDPNGSRFGNQGEFAYWDPYILVPGGWIYDTRHDSWWQLRNDDSLSQNNFFSYLVSAQGGFWAIPQSINTTIDPDHPAAWHFTNHSTDGFTWTSQPLFTEMHSRGAVREIVIQTTGIGRVTISVAANGDPSTFTTFGTKDVASNAIETSIFKGSVPAHAAIIKITAEPQAFGLSSNFMIHRMSVGVEATNSIGATF